MAEAVLSIYYCLSNSVPGDPFTKYLIAKQFEEF